jgi:hypothetical protein
MKPDGSDTALEALITRYCDAWGEPDPEQRQQLLAQVWAEQGTYTDPAVHLSGRQALGDYIGKILRRYPGARIVRTSAVDTHHGLLRFTWRLALLDGQTLTEGIDFGELSGEGKLSRIAGFFGPLAAQQEI